MNPKQRILSEALELSIEEQIQLARDILNNVAEYQVPHSLDLTPEQSEELERRYQNLLANPDSGSPWEEVEKRIRASR